MECLSKQEEKGIVQIKTESPSLPDNYMENVQIKQEIPSPHDGNNKMRVESSSLQDNDVLMKADLQPLVDNGESGEMKTEFTNLL